MITDALVDSFPVSQHNPSVAEVLEAIGSYQRLQADRDSEGSLPISEDAAHLAALLVPMVAHSATHHEVFWQPPVVGPNADRASTWSGK